MAKVYEVRDCEGINWGTHTRRSDAQRQCDELISRHVQFPRNFYVATGNIPAAEHFEKFEKPLPQIEPATRPAKRQFAFQGNAPDASVPGLGSDD